MDETAITILSGFVTLLVVWGLVYLGERKSPPKV